MNGRTRAFIYVLCWTLAGAGSQGCGITPHKASLMRNAIPAHRLPPELAARPKNQLVPIDFTHLRRKPPAEHVIGPDDVLGIYIQDVLAVSGQLPSVYYPPQGVRAGVATPSVGHPVSVRHDGSVTLPLVDPVRVAGLTLTQAVDAIRKPYIDASILREGRELITVDLIKPRTHKVFVVREDTGPVGATFSRRESSLYAKRGSVNVLDLPAYENDVLHALAESGGLPGIDGFNEIWILRGTEADEALRQQVLADLQAGKHPDEVYFNGTPVSFVRVPLRVCPNQPLPFSPADVVLGDGDVVFIESRDTEYFLTGGLIQGGKFPLPRDHDIDILEAIAVANANVNGPAAGNQGNAAATAFRVGQGNIIPPTRAFIIRKLPTGEQVKIVVDIKAAMNDPRERVTIMPGDFVLMKYKPHEIAANIAMNLVLVRYEIPNR